MYFINFLLFRLFGLLISWLPSPLLHFIARSAGLLAFYFHRPFRKKALSNLAIAYGETRSEEERKKIALASFQSLMITCLEFFALKKSRRDVGHFATLEENSEVRDLLNQKQGLIFFTGHQANWEVPFLAITAEFPGVAIGRPIKNPWLYRYILSVREMHGGKIVMPKNAIREGMKALRRGEFLGIVGDQAYPSSSYSYPLFGTRAWTASTPALLAYKTGSPLVVGHTERIGHKYHVSASPPIWPNLSRPLKEEVPEMMDQAMRYLEKSIAKKPEQWMWVHDRWKQAGVNHVKRPYRHSFILVLLSRDSSKIVVDRLRQIYPQSFFTYFIPEGHSIEIPEGEVIPFKEERELLLRDYRFQLVIDLYGSKRARKHYCKLGAFKALPPLDLETLTKTLVKPECLTTVSM